MARFQLKSDYRPYRLILSAKGPHRFGGPPAHDGVVPPGTQTPLHHMLSIDLADRNSPVSVDGDIRSLPLYYPLKYGQGGAEIQYAVLSDDEIEILYLSDETPDPEDIEYVKVPFLPESRARIVPLTYKEARILGFLSAEAYFKPNAEDAAILNRLYGRKGPSSWGNLIRVGGLQLGVRHAQDVFCRNPHCQFMDRRTYFDVVAAIPPVPVKGRDEFWHEFQGGDMQFCFGLCRYCGTVIAFNRAS